MIIQKEKQHVKLPLLLSSVVVFMSGKGEASVTQNKSLIQTKMQDLVPGMQVDGLYYYFKCIHVKLINS